MLSLFSRIVSGGDSEESHKYDDVFNDVSPSSSFSSNTDTDEELVVSLTPPIINIDQTEVGEDALALEGKGGDRKKVVEREKEDEEEEGVLEENEARKVVELVEYYLSDEHLVKDMFLLKHVTRHREGYISIKLLAAYKKVKRVAKGWRGVATALKTSEALQLSPDGTKVRRKAPLPPHLHQDTKPFRTVLAAGLNQDKASMSTMAQLFAKFGEVTALQLHRPGGRCIPEVRQAEQYNPGLIGEVCVLVEYDKVHHARHAIKHLLNTQEHGLRPIELPRPPSRASPRPDTLNITTTEGESAYYSTSDFSEPTSPTFKPHLRMRSPHSPYSSLASSPSPTPLGHRRRMRPQNQQSSPESSPPSPYTPRRGPPTPSSSPEAHYEARCCLHPPGSSPLPRRNLPLRDSPVPRRPATRAADGGNMGGNMGGNVGNVASLSPWLRRRVMPAGNASGSARSSPSVSPALRRRHDNAPMKPDNVTRFPRGPDGSKGFTQRRLIAPAHA